MNERERKFLGNLTMLYLNGLSLDEALKRYQEFEDEMRKFTGSP